MKTIITKRKYGYVFLCIIFITTMLLMSLQNEDHFLKSQFKNVENTSTHLMTTTSKTPSSSLKAIISETPLTRFTNTSLEEWRGNLKYICVNLIGRLGNQMFVFASGLGIANANNRSMIVHEGIEHLENIFNIHNTEKNGTLCKNAKTKYHRKASAFDPRLFNISNVGTVFVGPYLQSYKYFERIYDEIRSQFTFKKEIKDKADKIIKEIVENHRKVNNASLNWTVVGIHVRRGDMVNHPYGYNVASKEYFESAKQWFQSHYTNVIFVVCSNSLQWCKDNISDNSTYFISGNSAAEDMAVLSSCEHLISSVGSYSWWAGFLCKGNVTYYFPPAKEHSLLRNAYSADYMDYFQPKWIRL
ncbi:galactoside alpha-(1,2)-fucosyltransferase 2 [Octopus bimaculoides]|uniref:L-Fucosyltransferase n=1 Tax=Octopus bimaculoides TaxID=37653 RepID=A0A0L8H9T5_OCTBM|nr:galactoside alpha-(1,2)-fucosyltransferase 2 [Octopus bimaculoides]XP_052824089.1 galactoside alpha-(1,2)-fucosyltransferase 2 [Octopus bimaculoides]XP_052824090.1 galactoside alpha-(1,2)-fucosyltransferase 2 [Octopus bimaculoides]XP_052824091.1 galactoside alpha-(1,2)-fucosyltransferase 2 [Octopus bimaculoides]XP_052824092.1 galactoside alpha-(1,2)-fucosyltransferase 2 [Octopus bimaculoides]XP_052824093.1 galactoside alpha-(1,2)-fucosyltransferase 2 [Octopus bimaculoides]|eukprot:XP_014774199.1 PREDICTED: galactoside 2-alpha-L-fucosyltransferase 2-like [Octopus bimaculoides]